MDSTPDHKFIDNFSVVLSALALFTIVIIVAAVLIVNHSNVVNQQEPAFQQSLEERIRPVGDVVIAGQELTLLGRNANDSVSVAASVSTPDAKSGPATPGYANGEQVYQGACVTCHGLGIAGAPKMGDAAQWAPRVSTGIETLYKHAIEGYTGSAGVMPAKGGRIDLSDEQVKWSVDYMVEQSR